MEGVRVVPCLGEWRCPPVDSGDSALRQGHRVIAAQRRCVPSQVANPNRRVPGDSEWEGERAIVS